jgi:hypothetical protein
MTTKFFALASAFALALALVAPTAAQARQATNAWSAVQSLAPGTKIVVRTKDGDKLSGRFESADDQGINFARDGKRVTLTRESIRRVQVNRGKDRLKGALFGAGIGGGIGLGGGVAVIGLDPNRTLGNPIPAGIAVGAGAGAALGAAFGLGSKNETIYEAP